ncbi:amidohydrolase [Bordetella sp. 15P40C-2]|uniref:amidohydrolase family protein n=1 Tax=Bordetella sp. 15P40C-2 TaxID=2572246 RepID=UPI00132A1998|nr:amidohydrolase family protein [Bordetella sp. 15P40C-2]MVW71651.1 amidohydrolase family protein [Bordetella sp. 15P40C-2]
MIESRWPVPAEGCDCHHHIYDLHTYPLKQTSPVSPPHGTWEDYLAMRAQWGITRSVIVQAMGYGFDNRCTLDALAASAGSARAVISMPQGASDAQLAALAQAGVVGVRFQMVPNSGNIMTWDDLPEVARRIASLGWNINLQLDGRTLADYEALIADQPCNVVIDHVGKFLEPVTPQDPAFDSLRRLLDTGRVWVKLSAMYETSRTGAPDYQDVGVLAQALAHEYPERCLWASNWPHPGQVQRPNDRDLLALLDSWCPTQTVRDQILVHNPAKLYGF